MDIKKFKNGKIKMSIQKNYDIENDGSINENVYHDDMFMSDLSFNQINGYMYLVDQNTQFAYDLQNHGYSIMMNTLIQLLDELEKTGVIYFYPLTKKESKSLFQDLENGFQVVQ